MTKTLTWRLSKLPTVEELLQLVNDKIITQEEAKEILFRNSDDSERDSNSFKEEIKFLRDLVEKLSNNDRATIYKYIQTYPSGGTWTVPYVTWCGTTANSGSNAVYTSTGSTSYLSSGDYSNPVEFSSIKTF